MEKFTEQVTNDDVRKFLERKYPDLLKKYASDPNAINYLIDYISANGAISAMTMEKQINQRIEGDLRNIIKKIWADGARGLGKSWIKDAMKTAYTKMFGTQKLDTALEAALLCALTAETPIIHDFFSMQYEQYKKANKDPKCPFQKFIWGTTDSIVNTFLNSERILSYLNQFFKR